MFIFFLSTKYHSNACYKPYLLRAGREEKGKMKIDIEIDTTKAEKDGIIHATPRFVRWKEQSYL